VSASALFVLFIAAATAVGAHQPLPRALIGFTQDCENVPQPCWYGIVPGTPWQGKDAQILQNLGCAPIHRAEDYLGRQDFTFTCGSSNPVSEALIGLEHEPLNDLDTPPIAYIGLRLKGIMVGDFAALTGQPLGINPADPGSEDLFFIFNHRIFSYLPDGGRSLDVRDSTTFVLLYAEGEEDPMRVFAWHGFLPRWRYCQLEPDYNQC
jgi:hypothetical protein